VSDDQQGTSSADSVGDGFRRIELAGGTERGERGVQWAAAEMVRRQQTPLEGDESRRERWDEPLIIYVEEIGGFSEQAKDLLARLAHEGRSEGVVVSVRRDVKGPKHPVTRPVSERFDPPLEYRPYEEIYALVNRLWADIENRSTTKGRK